MTDYDYDGDFTHWQKKLDDAGIHYDVTCLSGCTFKEINNYVNRLLDKAQKEKACV